MNESTSTPSEASTAPSTPEHQPLGSQEARLEKVRKVYVRDLELGERVHTVFLVTRKARNVGRSGKAYLALVLSDKTGDVDGRVFDGIEQSEPTFGTGDYVLVQGEVISFHGKPQILVSTIERLDPEPIDRKEFTSPASPHDGKRGGPQLREVTGRLRDPHLKALLGAFFDEPEVIEALERPFNKGGPQAQRGTVADHLLSLAKLAQRLADHYPMVDRDLLVTGALLHDIAKLRELTRDKRDSDSVDEARLVGHAVMAAQAIHDKAAQIPNFPRALEHHVVHLVLSHLGSPDRGAPRAPMTLEALLLASIVQIDAEVSSWRRNKAPPETKPRRSNGAERRKSGAAPPAPESEPEVSSQEESQDKSLPKELVFKPLSEMATEAAPAEPAEQPPPSGEPAEQPPPASAEPAEQSPPSPSVETS